MGLLLGEIEVTMEGENEDFFVGRYTGALVFRKEGIMVSKYVGLIVVVSVGVPV